MDTRQNSNTPSSLGNGPVVSGNSTMNCQPQQTSETQLPAFDMGSALSRTFSTVKKNPTVFLGIALMAALPSGIIYFLVGDDLTGTVLTKIFETILYLIVQGAIAYATYRTLRHEAVNIGDSISRGTAHLVPMVVASILTGLGIMLGLLLLVVPGLILACIWSVTIPACVVERLGAIDSIKRSAELTKGYRWPIFGLALLMNIITIAFVGTLAYLIAMASGDELLASLVGVLLGSIPNALFCVMIAIIYYDLRRLKEGVSLDGLASVFD